MTPLHFEPPPDDPQDTTAISIPPPTLPPDDLRYQDECQEALRPYLDELIARALAANWDVHAVAYAVMMTGALRLKNRDKEEETSDPQEGG